MELNWKKNCALFLGGQAVSLFGSMLVQYALMWYVTLKTGSGSVMTIFIIVGIMPNFLISPFGGVWADRYNCKHLINGADAAIAFVTLVVAVFFIAGVESGDTLSGLRLTLLGVCAAIRALGQGVQTPAVGAFIPQICPEEHLTRVNGINGSIQSFTMIVCPLAAGALLQFMSITAIFFIDVVTAAIGISIVFFCVKVPPHATTEAKRAAASAKSHWHDIKEGIHYIAKQPFIHRLFIMQILFLILATPSAFLSPLQAVRNWGDEVWRLTAIEIVFSVGMLAGGVIISAWGGFKNKIHTIVAACVFYGLMVALLGAAPNFSLFLVAMTCIGVSMPFYNTPVTVLVQTKVDAAFVGRVFSVFGMISSFTMPAAMLCWGPLGDRVSLNLIMILCGAGIVLCSFPFLLSKKLREAGLPVENSLANSP